MMSQALFKCCGACGPVWHNVDCWRHLLFSGAVSRDMVSFQPKWFCLRMDVLDLPDSSDFFFSFFFNTSCYVSGTLECGIISFSIFLLFRSFPCSVYSLTSFFLKALNGSKITLMCQIAILLSSVSRHACQFPGYLIDIIWLACASIAKNPLQCNGKMVPTWIHSCQCNHGTFFISSEPFK